MSSLFYNMKHQCLGRQLSRQLDSPSQENPCFVFREQLQAHLIQHIPRRLVVRKQSLFNVPETEVRASRCSVTLWLFLQRRGRRIIVSSTPGLPILVATSSTFIAGSLIFATFHRKPDEPSPFKTSPQARFSHARTHLFVYNAADGCQIGVQLGRARSRKTVSGKYAVPKRAGDGGEHRSRNAA
jgi:hypothetical protein